MAINIWLKGEPMSNLPISGSPTFIALLAGKAANVFRQTGAAITRSLEAKLRDIVAVTDFETPDTADASDADTIFVPSGTHVSVASSGSDLNSNYWGFGQLQTADGHRRGKFASVIGAAPASLGNSDSIITAFDGDLSHSMLQIEHHITGAATLGQPTSGYVYTPEAYPFFAYLYNSSGWNNDIAGNGGRTAAAALRVKVDQYGQGDCVAYNATSFVASTRAGSTSFLANPAGSLFNGDMTAGADGVYLNPRELALTDGGFDVACIGDVVNFHRSNATGAKSVVWTGYRIQSKGTQPVDNLFSAVGKALVGIDLSMSSLDFGTNKAAVSLKANDRIYFNNAALASGSLAADYRTTTFNGYYLEYNSTLGAMQFVAGTSVFQIATTQVTATVSFQASTSVLLPGLKASASYANDAAAAAGGVALGQLYRNGSVVQIRVA